MKDHTDRIDNAIKDKFEGHEVQVPSNLWASIEANLPPEKGSNGDRFFFKNPLFLSIIIVSSVAFGTYLYTMRDSENNLSSAKTTNTNLSTDLTNNTSAQSITDSYMLNADNSISKHNSTTTSTEHIFRKSSGNDVLFNKHNHETKKGINSASSLKKHAINSLQNTTKDQQKNNSISKEKEHINNTSSTNNTIINATSTTDKINSIKDNFSKESSNPVSTNSNFPEISNQSTSDSKRTSVSQSDNVAVKSINSFSKEAEGLAKNAEANTKKSESNSVRTSNPIAIDLFTSAFIDRIDSSKSNALASSVTANQNMPADNLPKTDQITSPAGTNDQSNTLQIDTLTQTLYSTSTHTHSSEITSLYALNQQPVTTQDNTSTKIERLFTDSSAINGNGLAENNSGLINSMESNTSIDSVSALNSKEQNGNSDVHLKNTSMNVVFSKIDSMLNDNVSDKSLTEKKPESIQVKSNVQEASKKSLFLSRCNFDGYVTPALGYLHVSSNNPEDTLIDFKERNKNARTGFGITTGLRMNYALSQKVEIGIGLQYSSLNQQSTFTQRHLDSTYYTYHSHTRIDSTYDSLNHRMIYTNHLVTDSTFNTAFSNTTKQYMDKFQNFSIPIHIAYGYSISNKLSLLTRASILMNYQTYSVTYINEWDGTIVGHHSNKNISLGGSFSIGAYYQFSRTCSVFTEPIVTYYFSNLFEKQASFKQTQLMLGLQTGLRLSF